MSEALRRKREEYGLAESVRILSHRDDVPDLLAAADLFVFPSLYEGMPGAVLEAMALGLPIVSFDIPAVREVVEDRGNALLATPGSADDLASAVRELLGNRRLVAAFGRGGRQIFEERFTLETSVRRMKELYGKMAVRTRSEKKGC